MARYQRESDLCADETDCRQRVCWLPLERVCDHEPGMLAELRLRAKIGTKKGDYSQLQQFYQKGLPCHEGRKKIIETQEKNSKKSDPHLNPEKRGYLLNGWRGAE